MNAVLEIFEDFDVRGQGQGLEIQGQGRALVS